MMIVELHLSITRSGDLIFRMNELARVFNWDQVTLNAHQDISGGNVEERT